MSEFYDINDLYNIMKRGCRRQYIGDSFIVNGTTTIFKKGDKTYVSKLSDGDIYDAEKATKLACKEIDSEYMYGVYCTEYPQYFKEQAEKELKGEKL